MEFQFKKARWMHDSDGCWLMLQVDDERQAIKFVGEMLDKVYSCTIKLFRKSRSLDSNSYAWVVIGKIADILRASKEDVYFNALKHYGQSTVVSIRADIEAKGYFKYFEEIGEGSVNGKSFKHYRVFKGSSEYDSLEMAVLIDGIIQDAQDLGIDVMTPTEIERMKSLWGKEM